jgi:hypothetical protein
MLEEDDTPDFLTVLKVFAEVEVMANAVGLAKLILKAAASYQSPDRDHLESYESNVYKLIDRFKQTGRIVEPKPPEDLKAGEKAEVTLADRDRITRIFEEALVGGQALVVLDLSDLRKLMAYFPDLAPDDFWHQIRTTDSKNLE